MIRDWRVYQKEAKPVAELMKTINGGYRVAYEFDKDDFREGNRFLEEGMGSPREKWDIDLSKVAPITTGGHLHWGDNLENIRKHVLFHIVSQAIEYSEELEEFFQSRDLDRDVHFEQAFTNLTNAWRDEYALNSPFESTPESRTKTAEWRIVQCYYSIYKATSALLRSKFEEIRNGGGTHSGLWKYHRENCIEELKTMLYAFPFHYFPVEENPRSHDAFDWVVPYPIHEDLYEEQAEKQARYANESLSSIYESAKEIPYFEDKNLFTFYDLLQWLREWAQYRQGGIFSRLYGETHIKALDHALRLISYTGVAIAEVALISSFGMDDFEKVFREYEESCSEGNVLDSLRLVSERFEVYEQAFPVFDFDIELDVDEEED